MAKADTVITHAQRNAILASDLDAIRARTTKELATIQRQAASVTVRGEQELADRQRVDEQDVARINTEIADQLHAADGPLLAAWTVQPTRATHDALVEAYRFARTRTQLELAEDLWGGTILVGLATEIVKTNPAAVNFFGRDDWRTVEACGAFVRSLDPTVGDSERALTALEVLVKALAAAETGPVIESLHARFLLKKHACTHGGMLRLLGAFDAQQAQVQRTEFAASYESVEPREPFRDRARRVLGSIGL